MEVATSAEDAETVDEFLGPRERFWKLKCCAAYLFVTTTTAGGGGRHSIAELRRAPLSRFLLVVGGVG